MPDNSTIGLVLSSSVLAAVMTHEVSWLREHITKRTTAGFSGLYLAMALEAYGRQCATWLAESETFDESEGYAGNAHGYLPEMPDFPLSIEWRSLGIKLTADAIALPVFVRTMNAILKGTWDVADAEESVTQMREATVAAGLKAFELATTVRLDRNLPVVENKTERTWHTFLTEKNAEIIEANKAAKRISEKSDLST